ncbi:hypothetical protein Ga0074812_1095 [Parafrankia irregularis]|uniref:Uncharacterized protein n=1 Tax=Parafrankia irregularis TaxID=795642 RepID=A0A0S4QP36_9ACTN|nr:MULTISPECIES: hypothetical protein [Parafrankia]CUU56786.1 hypothetical protein Ga0074812_1095 [Parafrankia irregularis]
MRPDKTNTGELPTEPDDGVPAPDLVAAWLVLGMLPTEQVPGWAAHWIARGYDGAALVELAGLDGRDPAAVRDLIEAALRECGPLEVDVAAVERDHLRAAALMAFTNVAELLFAGRATERWVVDRVHETAGDHYFDESVMNLPLGSLFHLADEWDAGWGRPVQELRSIVRQACHRQLEVASVPGRS